MNVIEIRGLNKSFKSFMLQNIDLEIPSGSIVGLIGENGSGKTTLIKLILGLMKSDSGSVRIFDKDTEKKRHLLNEDIGYVPDEFSIPKSLNARRFGEFMKRTFRNWDENKYGELLKKFSLTPFSTFDCYSHGMKQKLSLAAAMSHNAKLLLLDEPTSSMDPVSRSEFVDMLYEYTKDEDKTVLISSHMVADLEKLCDYVVFLHDGKLILFDEKDALVSKYCTVRGTREQLSEIGADAVLSCRESPYGAEAVVLRDFVPDGLDIGVVTLEEIFVATVKGDG